MKLKDKDFEQVLLDLRQIASEMGIQVRFEKGDFKGGYCLLKSDKVIVINKNTSIKLKSIILAKALQEIGLDNIYINPKIRELVDAI